MNILVIGRFQLLHDGHVQLFKEAMKLGEKLLIGIGSSNESRTNRNPFTAQERKVMVSSVLDNLEADYSIYEISDINDPPNYPVHVEKIVFEMNMSDTIILSGNPYTYDCFEKLKYNVIKLQSAGPICASVLRQMIIDNGDWQKHVPKSTVEVMDEIGGVNIIKECCGERGFENE